jgi:membrane fusion protein (multidrug efflux system)
MPSVVFFFIHLFLNSQFILFNTVMFKNQSFHCNAKLFCAGMASSLLLLSCSPEKKKNIKNESFPIITPVVKDTVFAKAYVAEIQAVQNIELRARVKGFIEKVHVDEGRAVKQGQILFSISSRFYSEDLKKANALLKSAIAESQVTEVELKNAERLVEKNIVSPTEVAMTKAKLEAIRARVDEEKAAVASAELRLSSAEVRAPFAGVINRIPNKAGSLVEEGTLLTTLSNNEEVFAYFNMSEQEYLRFIRKNKKDHDYNVSLITADDQRYDQKGKIETMESEIDKVTGTIAFRARFPNPDRLLKHGASGKVLLNTPVKNALLIPQKATFEIQENLYVYVVNDNNTVELRRVIPKFRLSQLYAIESGLLPNDKILYEGIQFVKDGDAIATKLIKLDSIIAHH